MFPVDTHRSNKTESLSYLLELTYLLEENPLLYSHRCHVYDAMGRKPRLAVKIAYDDTIAFTFHEYLVSICSLALVASVFQLEGFVQMS